jgi:hypothetical protein
MRFDAHLPWPEAEALALADVLRQADPVAEKTIVERAPAPPARVPAHEVQGRLFAFADRGPYV